MTEAEGFPPEPEPGNVVAELRILAEAEVIPGPETLAKQEAEAAADDDDEPE
jgi:hypothetical protein